LFKEIVLNKIRISRYHRTAVPGVVRKFPEVKEGDEIELMLDNDEICIRKVISRQEADKTADSRAFV